MIYIKAILPFLITAIVSILLTLSLSKPQQGIDKRYVDSLVLSSKTVINYDSISSVIEGHILDSLNVSVELLNNDISILKYQNYKLKKSNEELERKYRSIIIDLPEL